MSDTARFSVESGGMDLILWRHAEAEDGAHDLQRALTDKGRRQAEAMADWLRPRLPAHTRLIASGARRSQQTLAALSPEFEIDPTINPDADFAALLACAGWPHARGAVVLVGHQPTIGAAISWLLAGDVHPWSVRKGAIWWLSNRSREQGAQTVLKAMLSPDMLRG